MIKGEVTLIKRDALTDEVKETIVQENTITSSFPWNAITYTDVISITLGQKFDQDLRIGINTTKQTTKEISTKWRFNPDNVRVDTNAYQTKYPNGSPAPYWEIGGRLLADPGNYTFYHVTLHGADSNGERNTFAYIVLDPPCVQAPGENIDIIYRVYFYKESLSDDFSLVYPIKNLWKHAFNSQKITPEGVDFSTNIAAIANYTTIAQETLGGDDTFERKFSTFWNSGRDLTNSPASSNTEYSYFNHYTDSEPLYGVRLSKASGDLTDLSESKRSVSINTALDDDRNGQVFASIIPSQNLLPFLPANNYIYDNITYNSPIQIIHNHSAQAIRPGSDIDYLATSTSRPNANGVNWTNPDFPKHYRLEVNGNGDTGSSVYYNWAVEDFHSYDHDTGTQNELYWDAAGEVINFPWLKGLATSTLNDFYFLGDGNDPASFREIKAVDSTSVSSGTGMHCITQPKLFTRFRHDSSLAKTHIMTNDFDGITLLHMHKGWFWNFDSARTNMNFSYLTQLTTDANNNIWCCDRNAGLIRISDIVGTPTANVMTVATNSIQTGNCYGVCFTGNNRIYAMFEGGLVYSDNPTLNDSNSITFTNSTFTARSSERSNITGLVGDPEHSDHHLAVLFANTTATNITQDIFWYTGSTQTTVKSASSIAFNYSSISDVLAPHDALVLNQKYYKPQLYCSDKNSIWMQEIFQTVDGGSFNKYGTGYRMKPSYFNDSTYYPSWPAPGTNGFNVSNSTAYDFKVQVNRPDFGLNRNNVPFGSSSRIELGGLFSFFTPEGAIEGTSNQEGDTAQGSAGQGSFYNLGTSCVIPNASGLCLTHNFSDRVLRDSTLAAGYMRTGISRRGMENYERDRAIAAYGEELSNPTSWDGRSPMGRGIRWRRYGWNGSAWVEGYGQPFNDTATVTGSKNSAVDLKRIGFDWNSPIFAGDAYCDGTELFDGSSYTWSASPDATFAFSLDSRDKILNAQTGQCIFDYHEPYTDNRISLWLNFKNRYSQGADVFFENRSSENLVLIANATGNTVFADLGSASAYLNSESDQFSANNRFVVTVNTTSANLYINATQVGGVTLTNPIDWRNPTGNAKFYIGVDAISDINGKSLPLNFLNGRMTNFAVHDGKFTISNIENDNTTPGSIDGPTNPYKAAEWLMSESLQDGRQTHTNEETIEDGIKVAWPSFVSNPSSSWDDGDFWTFVVSEGIFKDNTNEFDWENYEYLTPIDFNFTEVTDTSARTDRVMFSMRDEMISPTSYNEIDVSAWDSSNLGHVFRNGNQDQIVRWYSLPATGGTDFTVSGYLEYGNTVSDGTANYYQGIFVSDDPFSNFTIARSASTVDYGIYFNADPSTPTNVDYRIYEAAVSQHTGPAWKLGDKFEIKKVGTTITYHQNGTLIHTSTNPTSSNDYYMGVNCYAGGGWSNVEFTYTPPSDVKFIGNNTNKTGYQHKDFFRINTDDSPAIRNTTDSTDYEVLVSNDFYQNKPAPSTNQVVLDDVGYFVVPTGETADTFSANVVLHYTNHPGPDY